MRIKIIIPLIVLFALVLGACNLPADSGENDPGAVYTEAAKTLSAQMTQAVINTVIAQLTQIASGNVQTPTPTTGVASPSPTVPLATMTPTQPTSIPPTQGPPTATRDLRRCDHAAFVRDITISDGTYFTPGAEFTKTWRLQNIGSCTWDEDYSLVFDSGERMQGDRRSPLPDDVRPGETVDISLELIAPSSRGRYTGYWLLENADGDRFGVGDRANTAFWVEIRVVAANANFAYDFAVNMCSATWRSSAGSLSCPSSGPSKDGAIILLDRPTLENGRIEDEYTLWTKPQAVNNGTISGVYPPYKVKANDHFLAQIGCLHDNKGCSVTFTLDYIQSNGRLKNLGEWYEAYEGGSQIINIDLSSLAGENIQFVLGVIAESKPDQANAYWLAPSIRQVASPTPTRTTAPPTATRTVAPPTSTATTAPPTPTATQPQVTASVPTPTTPSTEPLTAVLAARSKLATDLNLDPNLLELISMEPREWPDTCLGFQVLGVVCSPVITPGYRMLFQYLDAQYDVHTNQNGTLVYWVEL